MVAEKDASHWQHAANAPVSERSDLCQLERLQSAYHREHLRGHNPW